MALLDGPRGLFGRRSSRPENCAAWSMKKWRKGGGRGGGGWMMTID